MNIIIDGKTCACEKGEFLRDIAKRNGINIPGLCHHAGLPGQGCCRVCVVEVVERGWSKIVVSCVYPVAGECEVFTDSDIVKSQRSMTLALLAKRAPHSKEVAFMCKVYGAPELPRLKAAEEGKCILCGLCSRACKELGTGAITTANRGIIKEIATPYHEPNPDCIGCASCANVCPTKAIEHSQNEETRHIWLQDFPLQYCSSCGVLLGTAAEVAYATKRAGVEPDGLCPECKQKKLAGLLAATYGL